MNEAAPRHREAEAIKEVLKQLLWWSRYHGIFSYTGLLPI